jgi:hypothetical protein
MLIQIAASAAESRVFFKKLIQTSMDKKFELVYVFYSQYLSSTISFPHPVRSGGVTH